jgi:hypothetical protein
MGVVTLGCAAHDRTRGRAVACIGPFEVVVVQWPAGHADGISAADWPEQEAGS